MKENILNGMNAMVKRALDDDLIRKSNKEVAKAIATISQAEDVCYDITPFCLPS